MEFIFFFVVINLVLRESAGDLDLSVKSNPYVEALNVRPWKSVQKYVEVRPGVFLFYWLYYADGTAADADKKPLVIWIQGGPGYAATGLANFAELGPLDMDFKPRNHTWVKGRNVLLIDHPAGTGFSYLTNNTLYAKTDREMATDLQRAIKAFFKRHKQFRKTPAYVVGQSYGGKITPRLGFYLHRAIKNNRLKMNFKGIGIGSGWVDTKESTLAIPLFLYTNGILNQHSYSKAMSVARKIAEYVDAKDYAMARQTQETLIKIIYPFNGMISFNNINKVGPDASLRELQLKVNKYVKPTLSHTVNQSLTWKYLDDEVWNHLETHFAPSVKFLELLLNTTNLKVVVFNGNLDVITPLIGASNWVHKLRWSGSEAFYNSIPLPITDAYNNGFYKVAAQFSFWAVFGAGHWVPEENPVAMEKILQHLMTEDQYNVQHVMYLPKFVNGKQTLWVERNT